MTPVLETDALTKRYGSSRGIDDVTMAVEPGEVFGFLGPNGAGKTTTIRLLLDLLRPSSGSARIFGLDTHRDGLAIRARTGNLPGDFTYDLRATGREVLAFCARARGVARPDRVAELARRFTADLDRPLGSLSRGNRQKIGLLQALFHDPELLILDEPTSGLDPLMQEEFLAVVAEHRDRGGTVLLSSHELDEVERICDRVAIIREGRLVAIEKVAELRRAAYRRVAIELAAPADPREWAAIDGVRDVQADGTHLAFKAFGDLDAVVKAAARHTVVDIEVTEPGLEEIFLGYYGEGTPA